MTDSLRSRKVSQRSEDPIGGSVLDPKGDMTNLALTFPDLTASSFRPWTAKAPKD